ncbi:MAG: DMT family transporter [Sandaracinaceae bacterium]|nr:DMT family transporter [Sandaracinaceae bacterium]
MHRPKRPVTLQEVLSESDPGCDQHLSKVLPGPGVRAVLWSALAFAVMGIFVKAAGRRIPSSEIVLFRSAITLLLSGYALYRGGHSPWGKSTSWLILRGVVGSVSLLCYFYSLSVLPLPIATLVQHSSLLWVPLLSWALLKEKAQLWEWLGVGVGAGGVVIAIASRGMGGGGGMSWSDLGIAGVGAVASALVSIIVRRLREEEEVVVVFQLPLIALPISLPMAIAQWVWPTPKEWLFLVGAGVATQFAQLKMTQALRHEPATRASVVGLSQLVFAMVLAWVFFDETPTFYEWIGAGCIFLGSWIAQVERRVTWCLFNHHETQKKC